MTRSDDDPETSPTDPASGPPPRRRGLGRVLIATSDSATRELLAKATTIGGVEVIQATDGMEALAEIRRGGLDLLLVDVFLAVLDGVSVTARTRSAGLADPPFIVLAGVTSDRIVDRALDAGADDVLYRPLNVFVVRRRVESLLRLRRSEAELRILDGAFEAAGSGLTILDARSPEFPVIKLNAAFASMTGFPKEELVGRNLRVLQGPETDVATMATLRESMSAGHACRVIIKNYKKDGSTFWNELSMSPIRDASGLLNHWVGIQTDAAIRVRVGELALAQQELEDVVAQRTRELNEVLGRLEQRRRFTETILNALSAGIITTDGEARLSFANRAAAELLGQSVPDCMGRPVLEVLGGSGELAGALRVGKEERTAEFDFTSPAGVRLRLEATIMRPPDEFRQEVGLVILFREAQPPPVAAAPKELQETEVARPPVETPAGEDDILRSGAFAVPQPRVTSPLALLQHAVEALRGRNVAKGRRPLVERPGAPLPDVSLDERQTTEVLLGLFEIAMELLGEKGRVRVRLGALGPGAPSPLARGSVRIDYIEDRATAAEGEVARAPWSRFVDLNLDLLSRLLKSNGGHVAVQRDPTELGLFSVFLPLAAPEPPKSG
jgi:PAS domain S-box-containing protein